ncbi:Eco57I restriction-modification methylase domain-containing protein [Photobacterium phosphoreum]|uniref:Eco57I restriction-modification methylase domain-containing protein n=1 Tax=Photobacterium phosphoreum TaxID=659 RepID=UPI001E52C643|nr:N-6 DNA methylase [Photobacterium phosphoreum]MCD9472599.1 restriction endonuclease subunit M [Photobacterium phosphoreum]
MRKTLNKVLRKHLESVVVKACDIVEIAIAEVLQRLGVAEAQAPSYLTDDERVLRNQLRGHARQLGDDLQNGKQGIERLANEMAYEHWHRMLFARYLEQNNLLMFDGTAVTLDECSELAEEEPDCKDGWELAGRLAQKMLPQIFRVDSPVFAVKLSINHINELETLISSIDIETFQAKDSLGWCYQFWQNKKKQAVNDSGVLIGEQELSSVTQLFTESYMVDFLLDNALGAWWANKRLTQDDLIRANNEQELRDLVTVPGISLEYLRFTQKQDHSWSLASSGFEKWPNELSQLKMLDPCCGSGHFLVAVFLMLVPMRMQLENLTEIQAIDAVLRDNIHGLELDKRCVELAAFALALEAWRYPNAGGYRVLPELQLACSGTSIHEAKLEWKDLAKDDAIITDAISWMEETFNDAPILGSLIDPTLMLEDKNKTPWLSLQDSLNKSIIVSDGFKVTAQGILKTAELLNQDYQWVLTNVPYLRNGKQSLFLQKYCECFYPKSKSDLATVFFEKCNHLLAQGGLSQLVLPANWLLQPRTRAFRQKVLTNCALKSIIRLGSGAFDTISGKVVNVILLTSNLAISDDSEIMTIDATTGKDASQKAMLLESVLPDFITQQSQMSNPDHRISLTSLDDSCLLSEYSHSYQGIKTSDDMQFVRCFSELSTYDKKWDFYKSSSQNADNIFYGGMSYVVLFEQGKGRMRKLASSQAKDRKRDLQGSSAWCKSGVSINAMTNLTPSLYLGNKFDTSCSAVIPTSSDNLAAVWCYCSSPDYLLQVREIDQSLKVTNATLVKVNFDLSYWSEKALEIYPNGLPCAFSNDPTQWIFHGHPCASIIWDEETKTTAIGQLRQNEMVLQVAVARLLGYQWPAELESEMALAPEMRKVMEKNADFIGLIDDDGIVCLPAVRGEKNAAKRLEAILVAAYGNEWNNSIDSQLLKSVNAKDWESWLRDKFFEQHLRMFQYRPFIWQVWDGLKDGFSALVNYHKLDYKGLERLIYTYLDDWISSQKRDVADEVDGADIRLTAAENLKIQLEAILEGEKGLDIFVRWKPLEEQSIGWNPDLNDGVRLNIRPFMLTKDVGKKGAGVLRAKPNIHWKNDRGTDSDFAPWFDLGLEYGGKQGDRINEHHLSLAEKKAARDNQ